MTNQKVVGFSQLLPTQTRTKKKKRNRRLVAHLKQQLILNHLPHVDLALE